MPGLYRMLQPLVGAGFVGMFSSPLSFSPLIEISAARTTKRAFMDPRRRRSFIGNNLPPYFIWPSYTLFVTVVTIWLLLSAVLVLFLVKAALRNEEKAPE